MATRLYGAEPGYSLEQVTEGVGSAVSAHNVELTVNLATTVVQDNGATRAVSKLEVIIILELFKEYIVRSNWAPA